MATSVPYAKGGENMDLLVSQVITAQPQSQSNAQASPVLGGASGSFQSALVKQIDGAAAPLYASAQSNVQPNAQVQP